MAMALATNQNASEMKQVKSTQSKPQERNEKKIDQQNKNQIKNPKEVYLKCYLVSAR